MRANKNIVIPGILAGSLVAGALVVSAPAAADHTNGGIAQAVDFKIGSPPLPVLAPPQEICLTVAGTKTCKPTGLVASTPGSGTLEVDADYVLSSSTHPSSIQHHTGFVCPDTPADPDSDPNLGMIWRVLDATYQPHSSFSATVSFAGQVVSHSASSTNPSKIQQPLELYLC